MKLTDEQREGIIAFATKHIGSPVLRAQTEKEIRAIFAAPVAADAAAPNVGDFQPMTSAREAAIAASVEQKYGQTIRDAVAAAAQPDERAATWQDAFNERHEFDVYDDHFMTGLRNEFCAGWHAALKQRRATAPQTTVKCRTCNDHGMIGGPSYREPDEGGVPCPDCATAPQAGAMLTDERGGEK